MTSEELKRLTIIANWMDKAKDYAESKFSAITDPFKPQWIRDAIYVSYLRGVEEALHIRIIN